MAVFRVRRSPSNRMLVRSVGPDATLEVTAVGEATPTLEVIAVGEATTEQSPPDDAAASAKSSAGADAWAVAVAVLAVALYWLLAFQLRVHASLTPQPAAVLAEGVGLFALLYIAAQAIERILEPFSKLDPKKAELVKDRDDKAAAAQRGAQAKPAADAQGSLDRWRANRAVLLWGAATVLGMFGSAAFGIYLLRLVVVPAAEGGALPSLELDILVTGLAIGGGTKPLHDLISRIEKSKNAAADSGANGDT